MVLLIGRTYLSGFCGLFQGCAEAEERVRQVIIRIKNIKEGEQLENYTKYKLKSKEELASVLEGKDNLS